VKFKFIDATKNPPAEMDKIPEEALMLDRNAQAAKNIEFLKSKEGLPDHITSGGYKIGDSVWRSP
jgi:hypothetical protein